MKNKKSFRIQFKNLDQASSGFIILEREKIGRGNIVPRLKFNYDRIIVELPEHPCELAFRAAS